MTTAIIRRIPYEWQEMDEDNERISDSFHIGMEVEVSTKGDHCRIYQPEDVDIPFNFLEYVDGDYDERFLTRKITLEREDCNGDHQRDEIMDRGAE
tara:strand:+ start:2316 stop:2603 length:288 start_codon:yes stop_codon:yes gene_type:complete